MVRSYGANLWSTTLTAQMGPTDLAAAVSSTAGPIQSPAWMVVEKETAANVEVVYFDGSFDGTTFRVSVLANRYKDGSAAGSGLTHPVGATVISSPLWSQFDDVWDYIEAHEAASDVHGAVSTATANTIVRRDANARFRATSPSNSSDVATKGYVDGVIPIGGIIIWSGSVGSIPAGWQLCDGTNSTPDLRNRFVIGAGSTYSPGASGGSTSHTHQGASHTHSGPSHTHSWSDTSSSSGSHNHGGATAANTNHETRGTGSQTSAAESHAHSLSSDGSHTHFVSGTTGSGGTGSTGSSGSGSTSTTSHLPSYYALAYIQRIS